MILTKIPGPDKKTQVTRILTQIPNLTSGVIQNQLKALPWLLPQIQDLNLQKNIAERLEKVGCSIIVKYVELPPEKTDGRSTQKKKEPAKKIDSKPVEIIKRKYVPPEEMVSQISAVKNQKKKKGNREWVVLLGLLLSVGIIYWLSTLSYGPDKKIRPTEKVPERKTSSGNLENSNSDLNSKQGLSHNNATGDGEKSNGEGQSYSQKLEKDLEKNPFNTEAWNKLIRYHREQGNTQRARQFTKESWEKNEKVRAALQSIARKFGTPVLPMELSHEKFKMDLYVRDGEPALEKGQKLYGELQPDFGDKQLQVYFRSESGDVYEMDVPPGKGELDQERMERYIHKWP